MLFYAAALQTLNYDWDTLRQSAKEYIGTFLEEEKHE